MSHHIHQFVSPLSQTFEEKQPVAVRVFFRHTLSGFVVNQLLPLVLR